ncbi:ABC transporter substrate-binding protein [Cellulomonas marina]|uniref:Alpha-glucoside transport system substrate-binding protein n=1 Tax=Cellulomonas marina TaxID=988821 RepID=A0A1I1AAD4_9CELL|nr:ABC transporter substrate-binding protein [Cellulomonas marina]GIG29587.1 sugar ABC transporter substrate-binding protein [Cellulomonas marina]SFB33430.1 alpha-glucoside transport system substrate-binding protein [Cellulomonas marina]
MRFRTPFLATTTVLAVAALTTGCLASEGDGGGGGGGGGNAGGDGGDNTVEIMLGFTGAQLENFQASVDPWAEENGITIEWSPSDNFNQLINTRVQGNDLPDIAMFPQPGVLMDLVDRGSVLPLDDVVDVPALEEVYTAGTLDVGTRDGSLYGLLVSMNVKSLVFYPKGPFEEAGYTAPESIDDLLALTDTIRESGTAPWCLGIESGTATGWPATDWMEELVLKYGGVEQYNQWLTNEIKFDSDLVRQAAATFEQIAFTEGNVLGGRQSIASNNFGTAGNPMFETPPGCMMYKQGNFIAASGFFPDDVLADIDNRVGVFGFPPAEAGGDNPVEGGGDLAAMLVESDAAKQVIEYMSSEGFGAEAAQAGSFISPRTDFDPSNYPSQTVADIAQVAYDATAFAFDGSDSMPGAVGSGSFWRDMTSWISGQQDLDTTLTNIDQSWPTS